MRCPHPKVWVILFVAWLTENVKSNNVFISVLFIKCVVPLGKLAEGLKSMDFQVLKRNSGGVNKPDLAYVYTPPKGWGEDLPIVMFCGGYRSDMQGSKATHFEEVCRVRNQGYLRFDYSGHGRSSGKFTDGTIGSWFEDTLDIFDAVIGDKDCIIVGSSMGGWIGLLLAHSRPSQVKAYIGIAAAPDFTEEMYHSRLDDAQRAMIETTGRLEAPNDYSDEPYIFTKALFDDGRQQLVLDGSRPVCCPMRLFHGMEDKDVSADTPHKIKAVYQGDDFDAVFIEDGGHSLSRPQDLVLIGGVIVELSNL